MTDVIADGKVVAFNYTLTNSSGELIDSSENDPLPYLHGAGNIVPGLEREMTGKKVGDAFKVVVSAAEGYGERQDTGLVMAPLEAFPEGTELAQGMALVLEDEEGNPHPAWIAEITDQGVVLDRNHPLAGQELHFAVEVAAIRDATAEEMNHGHPHGLDGHADH